MKTVKEIINHALELLDMDGSNVIDYKETNNYLDKSWRILNQSLANRDIHYFLKKMEVVCGANALPWNFGQISAIRNRAGYLLNKRTADMADNTPCYDIVGNTLYIYGIYGEYIMEYYEKPITLTFPAKKREIEVDINPQYAYDKFLVSVTNNKITIYNIQTQEKTQFNIDEGYTTIKVGKQIVVEYASEFDYYNYKGEMIAAVNKILGVTYSWVILKDKTVVPAKITSDDNIYAVKITGDALVGNTADTVTEYGETYMVQLADDKIYLLDDANAVPTIFEDCPGWITKDSLNWIADETLFTEKIETEEEIVALLKADWNTGYGYVTTDGTTYYIESFVPDTALDFPATLMYDYLASLIAACIARKVGVNYDGSSIEYAFFDSIDNSGSYPTIRNVYGNGGL